MTSYDARVFLPGELLVALGEHTGHFWSSPMLEPIICDAVRAWMKPAPAVPQQPVPQSEAGYQWKQLFLPEGTGLRACFGGQPYFAAVEGAQIKYGDQSISPSGFANLHGSGNRNAWQAVWLRLPGNDQWLLADVCRSARQNAIARLLGDDAHAAGPKPAALSAVRQEKAQQPDRQSASRRTPAGGVNDDARAATPKQAAARQTEARPSSAPQAAQAHSAKHKNGSQRAARHKRRAAKHVPSHP